ncbi:MAG TPA: hypothetical protein VF818_10990 [Ktedonobacterales bacterium]
MEYDTTVLHVQGVTPETIEHALTAIFTDEGRSVALRLEGTFQAVLGRLTDPDLEAGYLYLICRPHAASAWTPVLELGNRADGLDIELSRVLDGATVVTTFVYGEGISGYRVARAGALVDRYTSDPTYFADEEVSAEDIESQRGHPERFADLFPANTPPADFARVVLLPGWWETYEADDARAASERTATERQAGLPDTEEDEELVDEVDRMRCIALGLELWGPEEYPFARELETLPNHLVGPAIALAFA